MPHKNWLVVAGSNTLLLIWENWLARTERVAAGSTIELLLNGWRFILKALRDRKGVPMLEGKELDIKLGNVGSAFVDVSADGAVAIGVSLDVKESVLDGIDFVHKSETSAKVSVVKIVVAQAAKSDSKILKLLAAALAKLDKEEELHPEVVAALEAHVQPVA